MNVFGRAMLMFVLIAIGGMLHPEFPGIILFIEITGGALLFIAFGGE